VDDLRLRAFRVWDNVREKKPTFSVHIPVVLASRDRVSLFESAMELDDSDTCQDEKITFVTGGASTDMGT
jgi:hypothetical protein